MWLGLDLSSIWFHLGIKMIDENYSKMTHSLEYTWVVPRVASLGDKSGGAQQLNS